MRKLKNMMLAGLLFWAGSAGAQSLPSLHVEGRNLVDTHGNTVVLHGVMDTPSPYFNNNRWGNSATDANKKNCIEYFDKLSELSIEDNRLLFLTENQGTCRWAIDLDTNKIWMRTREWQEDNTDIDTFIRAIMYYNCAEAGYPYGACLEPHLFPELKQTLDKGWEEVSNYDGLYIYALKDNLIWFFGKDGMPGPSNSIFLSCRRRDNFTQLCSSLGFVAI